MMIRDKVQFIINKLFYGNKNFEKVLVEQINTASYEWEQIWKSEINYVAPEVIKHYRQKWQQIHSQTMLEINKLSYSLGLGRKSLKTIVPLFLLRYNALDSQLQDHNNTVTEKRINWANKLICPVENRQLDNQQLSCIVKEAHSHLVLAGAGTGKTTTIVGYIKYLLLSGKCHPEDILLLSFTNNSANEMKERITSETNQSLDVFTFHKLGMKIITSVLEKKPHITSIQMKQFISKQIEQLAKNERYLKKLCHYLIYYSHSQKTEFDFTNEQEYQVYLQSNPITTRKNETVKSHGEKDIANFLFENGVRYFYESPYPIDTRTAEYGQYYPDFFLPDYNLYIEYFGINHKSEVPSYFSSKPGKTPSETYRAGMLWKRKLHQCNKTDMIEVYFYEQLEETLLTSLAEKLKQKKVILTPCSPEEIWAEINSTKTPYLESLSEFFGSIISLIKSNDVTIADVIKQNKSNRKSTSIRILLELITPIFDEYQRTLRDRSEIDFNDMINLATKHITAGDYQHHYNYVIIDEYQDISKARFQLLDVLRKQKDYQLFCVGDDWQSIYRFSGSDIGFILNFEKYWGPSEHSEIETTYRFPKSLIDISGTFIMKNPCQKKKTIQSQLVDQGFSLESVIGYTETYAMHYLMERLKDLPQHSSVFFLGRYAFDVQIVMLDSRFSVTYNPVSQTTEVCFQNRPDLQIKYLTIHKAKGLQADYIFILNNKRHGMGFPSKFSDAPILQLLMEHRESYPDAEERRLFYVALTRAKKKVWLLILQDKESEFVQELKLKYRNEMLKEQYSCPLCHGRLVKRKGTNGEFFGCYNFRSKNCRYTRNIFKKSSGKRNLSSQTPT